MKRNKRWYKGQERRMLRRQRILLAVTLASFAGFILLNMALYLAGK